MYQKKSLLLISTKFRCLEPTLLIEPCYGVIFTLVEDASKVSVLGGKIKHFRQIRGHYLFLFSTKTCCSMPTKLEMCKVWYMIPFKTKQIYLNSWSETICKYWSTLQHLVQSTHYFKSWLYNSTYPYKNHVGFTLFVNKKDNTTKLYTPLK